MNQDKILNDNYKRINQISARCMRVIDLALILGFFYCYFISDIDPMLLAIVFGACFFVALIPTLVVNVLKIDHSAITKHVVIVCIS